MIFPPYTTQTKLVAIIALFAVAFALGWRVHGWKIDAGEARSITQVEKTRESDEGGQGSIVSNKQDQQETVRTVYKTIKEKVYVQDDQSVCFTAESLQLWNSAIGANTDLHRRKSAGEAEASGAAEGVENSQGTGEDIVATVRDTLVNATDNFETCTDNSVKHLALIERVRSLQGKMCYCSK